MSPFDAYCLYLALKLHFSDDGYDFFKYNGKGPFRESSFKKRSDRYDFEKLAKREDPKGILVSCFSVNDGLWIRDILSSEKWRKRYDDHRKYRESVTYSFVREIEPFYPAVSGGGDHSGIPVVLRKLVTGEISPETAAVLANESRCLPVWKNKYSTDPLVSSTVRRVGKLIPFLEYDQRSLRSAVEKRFGCRAAA